MPTFRSCLLVICLILFQLSCSQPEPIRPILRRQQPKETTRVVIAAVGDIMMPLTVQRAAAASPDGYDKLFEMVRADLSAADIVIANLETPIDDKAPPSGYPRFNARPDLLSALKSAGIGIISVANNHIMDRGTEGLRKTLTAVESAGLIFVGAGRTKAEAGNIPLVVIRGTKVAFLAYTYDTNERLPKKNAEQPGVNVLHADSEPDLERAADQVRRARNKADLVVLSLHWGTEYETRPNAWQKRVATVLVEAGADILVGHHPHVLQPVQTIMAKDGRRGLVAFSLGNFLSSQSAAVGPKTKSHVVALRGDSLILYVSVRKTGSGVEIDHAEYLPTWTLREPGGKAVLYRPIVLARSIEHLRSGRTRNRDDEQLLELLAYRYDHILKQYQSGERF